MRIFKYCAGLVFTLWLVGCSGQKPVDKSSFESQCAQTPPVSFLPKQKPVISCRLENGLRLVMVENHRTPTVWHAAWYAVGSVDESTGNTGLAHFLEHLMFKGTLTYPKTGYFSERVARIGGEDNAFTSQDVTVYHQTVYRDYLPEIMTLEADRMRNLLLKPEEVDPELNVVLEEYRMRFENNPKTLFNAALMEGLFGKEHPYGRSTIGYLQDIKKLDAVKAKAFYDEFYHPNFVTVVISGDIDPQETFLVAKNIYGRIPAKENPRRSPVFKNATPEKKSIILKHELTSTPIFSRYYRVPSAYTMPEKHSEALDLFVEVLGDTSVGRLYRHLVVERKKAVAVYAHYSDSLFENGIVRIVASPAQGVSQEELEQAVQNEIDTLLKDGPTEQELARVKKSLKTAVILGYDSFTDLVNFYASRMVNGQTVERLHRSLDIAQDLTVEDLKTIPKMFLKQEHSVQGWLLPTDKRPVLKTNNKK